MDKTQIAAAASRRARGKTPPWARRLRDSAWADMRRYAGHADYSIDPGDIPDARLGGYTPANRVYDKKGNRRGS